MEELLHSNGQVLDENVHVTEIEARYLVSEAMEPKRYLPRSYKEPDPLQTFY